MFVGGNFEEIDFQSILQNAHYFGVFKKRRFNIDGRFNGGNFFHTETLSKRSGFGGILTNFICIGHNGIYGRPVVQNKRNVKELHGPIISDVYSIIKYFGLKIC